MKLKKSLGVAPQLIRENHYYFLRRPVYYQRMDTKKEEIPRSRSTHSERATRRANTRELLIRLGMELFTQQGFQATGIDQIMLQGKISKGSFYHFFPSKQGFGLAVIDAYAHYFNRKLAKSFDDVALTPIERLAAFTHDAMRGMEKFMFMRGCLVGNLGQELGGLDDTFRTKLEAVLQGWQNLTQRLLEQALLVGELPATSDCKALAEFFWIGWEGAILRAKLTRSNAPLESFSHFFLSTACLQLPNIS